MYYDKTQITLAYGAIKKITSAIIERGLEIPNVQYSASWAAGELNKINVRPNPSSQHSLEDLRRISELECLINWQFRKSTGKSH